MSLISQFTDQNRRGSERCQYCGGYHHSDAEFQACADLHSSSFQMYICSHCGHRHATQGAADSCCDAEKRYNLQYSGHNYDAGYDSDSSDYSGSSGGIFDSFFNAGGSKSSNDDSDSGIASWFFGKS